MTRICVYRQERVDGGVRTGIRFDDTLIFHLLEGGDPNEFNPALAWFLDIELEGESLPANAEAILRWLIEHQTPILHELRKLAEDCQIGLDEVGFMDPIEFAIDGRQVQGTIRYAVNRSAAARAFSERVSEYADHWLEILSSLERWEPVGATR